MTHITAVLGVLSYAVYGLPPNKIHNFSDMGYSSSAEHFLWLSEVLGLIPDIAKKYFPPQKEKIPHCNTYTK